MRMSARAVGVTIKPRRKKISLPGPNGELARDAGALLPKKQRRKRAPTAQLRASQDIARSKESLGRNVGRKFGPGLVTSLREAQAEGGFGGQSRRSLITERTATRYITTKNRQGDVLDVAWQGGAPGLKGRR